MEKNFQRKLIDIANGICLFDCYLTLGGIKTFEDKLYYLRRAISNNIVGPDGYVNDANLLYSEILGKFSKVIKAYEYKGTDNVIACWDHKHFTIVDKDGNMVYDPLGERENPYKNITSYRIVKKYIMF